MFSLARLFLRLWYYQNNESHRLEHPVFITCLWLTPGKPEFPYVVTLVEKRYQMHWFAFLN